LYSREDCKEKVTAATQKSQPGRLNIPIGISPAGNMFHEAVTGLIPADFEASASSVTIICP
jgi:hypothetical protein